jgi:hypothetical protein
MVLLYVLLLAAGGTWLTQLRTTEWDTPLWVVVHPIAAASDATTARYIEQLNDASFADIETFFAREGQRHGVPLRQPFVLRKGTQLSERPPAPPRDDNPLEVIWWSLHLRWWSWRVERNYADIPSTVRIYVVLHDPKSTVNVPHSLGLQKALVGVVHGFSEKKMSARNNVVIAHELLHTVGATDKYNPATSLPSFPGGFAEPRKQPRFPQQFAELMGGRIPLSATHAQMPKSLKRVRIGAQSALEIRWRD